MKIVEIIKKWFQNNKKTKVKMINEGQTKSNAENKEEFDAYVQKVKSLTPYNIEESAVYGENLLTLSTCAYHTNEGRYVVVAKKIKN